MMSDERQMTVFKGSEASNNHDTATTTTQQSVVKRSVKDAIAGGAAGAISKTVTAPVERIKLVMQLRFSIEKKSSSSSSGSLSSPKSTAAESMMARKLPKSAWGVAKTIYIEEGVFAFWRGE